MKFSLENNGNAFPGILVPYMLCCAGGMLYCGSGGGDGDVVEMVMVVGVILGMVIVEVIVRLVVVEVIVVIKGMMVVVVMYVVVLRDDEG